MRDAMLTLFLALITPSPANAETSNLTPAETACQANTEKQKALSELKRSADELRKKVSEISAGAERTASLVTSLSREVPRCEADYGSQVADAILRPDEHLRLNLIQRIQEVNRRTKEAGLKVTKGLDEAGAKYAQLDFCSLDSCSRSFEALGELLAPVGLLAKDSADSLRLVKQRYISPATRVLTENKGDIEWVLSGERCNRERGNYHTALQVWENVERQLKELEQKIAKQGTLADSLAKSAAKSPSRCGPIGS